MVNYDGASNNRGGVSVETITPTPMNMENEYHTTKSTLTIRNATPKDAGNYTCKPSNAIQASIQVFVSEGNNFPIQDFIL